MTTAALKKKIKALVDKETSEQKLEKVHSTLIKETKAEAVRRRMNEVAQASERDIKAGRTMSIDQLSVSTDRFIDELYSGKQSKVAASRKPKFSRVRSTKASGK